MMVDNNVKAMARQIVQKANLTTPNDSTAKIRMQHILKAYVVGSFMDAVKALTNMPQVQEPTDSTTREITWPGMNIHYEGDVEVPVTHTYYENGDSVGQTQENVTVHYEGDQGYHNENDVPKEK